MNQDQIEDAEAFRRSEMDPDSASDKAWYRFYDQVEKLIGHCLDGDGNADGYSIDQAHDWFEAGTSAAQAAAWIIQNRAADHRFSANPANP